LCLISSSAMFLHTCKCLASRTPLLSSSILVLTSLYLSLVKFNLDFLSACKFILHVCSLSSFTFFYSNFFTFSLFLGVFYNFFVSVLVPVAF
jgi:hypothetical protein